MNRFRPKLHWGAVLLAFVAMGHAQLVFACARMSVGSERGSCCPPVAQQPVSDADGACEKRASERSVDCNAVFDLIPSEPALADPLSAPELSHDHDTQTPLLASSAPPISAHLIPPPIGPPALSVATLPGKHTYLATLRLRI